MPYDEQDDRDALTPTERGAFEQLPRTRVPSPRLEETTVRALRQRGLLKSVDRSLFRRVATLSAAAMFLFAAGAAARVGIQVGDTLIAVDGHSILTSEGSRRLSLVRPGDRISLTLHRSGQTINKVLVLGPPPPMQTSRGFQYTGRLGRTAVA